MDIRKEAAKRAQFFNTMAGLEAVAKPYKPDEAPEVTAVRDAVRGGVTSARLHKYANWCDYLGLPDNTVKVYMPDGKVIRGFKVGKNRFSTELALYAYGWLLISLTEQEAA